ncbi:hypothetical protein BC835DRAFT_452420 [Cytidiella melzeri]|nr:hypothetical protein BC835DRAFT_452420 [Cytidiella melzeri]
MSNGQNNAAPAQELTIQLHSLLANQVFTDAHHASVVEHIRRARAMLDNVEQEAHNRHGMYQNAVKALQDRIVAGQQAQQMLARLGAQVPPNVPLIDSVNGFPPAQAPSVTIQQSTQRQPPYPILTTANGSEIPRAGPSQHSTPGSHAPQQPQHFSPVSNPPPPPPHFSPVSYAPKPKTPTGYQSIPTQWQPYNHQQPIPPQQHASQAQTSSRTSGPQMTANDPQRHYREFITPRAPPQAQTANGTFTQHQLAVPQQPQTAQNRPAVSPHLAHSRPAMLPPSAQSRSAMLPPSAQSPSAPTPQSAARGATTHSSGGVSSASPVLPTSPQIFGLQAGQNARAGTSHTLQSSQNPSKTATPSDVAVEVHNVLKSLRIDIIQTIIRLCMQTLHRMSRLSLTPREVQIVNATQVDAQRANDVNIVVSILVQKLQHLTSSEIMTILRTAMRVQRLPDILPNTNVQRLPPSSPAVPGSSVTTVADNARTKPPSSSTESTVITNHPSLATPLISTQPISYPSSLSVPRVPDPATSSPIDSSKSKMGHIGGTFGSFRVDGTLDASHPAHQSTNRSAYTVLNTPSASQASQARHTPPLSPGGALLSPNTKTLARDILRSLGRRTDSSGTNSSSVGIVAKSPALNEHQPPSAPQEQHEQLPTATSNATSGPNQQKSAERELIVIADDSSTSPQPGGAEEATTNGDIAAKQRPQLQPLLVDEPEDPLPDVHDMLQGQPSAPVLVEDVAGPAVPLVPASPILKTTSVEEILQSISIPQVSTASLDDLAPAVPLAPTSPIMSSAATPPPTSRSSTPVEPEAKISTPTPQPAPVAGPSKEPLFLASPSTSSVSVENHMMADNAGSEGGTDAFIPTGLLDLSPSQPAPPAYKGKGRGLDSDSEEGNMDMAHLNSSSRPFKRRKVEHTAGDTEVVETSEPEERAADRPRRTRVKLEVVVPPLPELFQRAEASRLSSPWGTRTRPLVVLSGSSSPVMAVDGDNESTS